MVRALQLLKRHLRRHPHADDEDGVSDAGKSRPRSRRYCVKTDPEAVVKSTRSLMLSTRSIEVAVMRPVLDPTTKLKVIALPVFPAVQVSPDPIVKVSVPIPSLERVYATSAGV